MRDLRSEELQGFRGCGGLRVFFGLPEGFQEDFGLKVQGLGFRVEGLGFRV